MENAFTVEHVTRRYPRMERPANDGLSFEIATGEMFASQRRSTALAALPSVLILDEPTRPPSDDERDRRFPALDGNIGIVNMALIVSQFS